MENTFKKCSCEYCNKEIEREEDLVESVEYRVIYPSLSKSAYKEKVKTHKYHFWCKDHLDEMTREG